MKKALKIRVNFTGKRIQGLYGKKGWRPERGLKVGNGTRKEEIG